MLLEKFVKKNLIFSAHDSGLELQVYSVDDDPDRVILYQSVTENWIEEVIIRKDTLQEICKRLIEPKTRESELGGSECQ